MSVTGRFSGKVAMTDNKVMSHRISHPNLKKGVILFIAKLRTCKVSLREHKISRVVIPKVVSNWYVHLFAHCN